MLLSILCYLKNIFFQGMLQKSYIIEHFALL